MASKLKLTELLYPTSTTAAITINSDDTVTFGAPTTTITNLSATNLAYTGTLTGGTGVVNLGSGQVYKDASGNVGIGTTSPSSFSAKLVVNNGTNKNTTVRGGIRLGGSAIQSIQDNAATDSPLEIYTGSAQLQLEGNPITFYNGGERMRIDSSGNVGIGTSSPGVKLDVAGAIRSYISGGTPIIYFGNGTTQHSISNASGAMPFAIDGTERMRIDSSGNLLVGTTSVIQTGMLSVAGAICSQTASAGFSANLTTSSGDQFYFRTNSGANLAGYINCPTASTTSYLSISDYRLKENVLPMTGALAKIAQLNPCTYTWKADGLQGQGFIAHELQAVVPDCVAGEKDAIDKNGKPKYQGVDTSFLVATLVAAIQEQQALIQDLTTRLTALEAI